MKVTFTLGTSKKTCHVTDETRAALLADGWKEDKPKARSKPKTEKVSSEEYVSEEESGE